MANNGWQEVSLTEIYEIHSGLSKPRAEFGFGYGFLTFKDVLDNYFVPDTLTALVNSTEKERETCSVQRGDVFLTRTSETMEDLGMSCVAMKDYPCATFNGFTKRLRPKPDATIIPEYAAYFFRSPRFRRDVTAMSSLSTRASLNNEMIARLRMVLPPADEQNRIGRILKSLDDKIELNRRMNETLEAMARRLFRSWFVDFDPVHAKAALRHQHPKLSNADLSRRALPHMAPDIAELFPDRFEDSTLGPIPKGWKVEEIGNVITVLGGGTPSTKSSAYWVGGTHPFCTPKDMAGLTSHVLLRTERHLTDVGVAKVSSGRLPIGTVLLSSRAPIGYLAIAHVPVTINQGIIAMVCDAELPNQYVLHWARTNEEAIIANANGSTFLEISKRNFRPLPVVVPHHAILEAFQSQAAELHELVAIKLHESHDLGSCRDKLLPRLLSGEFDLISTNTSVRDLQ